MVKLVKYDRKGKAGKYAFSSLAKALGWLMMHFNECEWCWIAYNTEENDYV